MKKVLIFLSLSILLGSCSLGGSGASGNTALSPGDTATPQYQKDINTVSSKISASEEFKSCMDMNVPMCIQNAGMQLAQKERSIEFCAELPEASQKESCVFAVTMINAQEKNDKSLCDTLTGEYARQCTISMIRSDATTKKDPKICETLPAAAEGQEDTIKDECRLNVLMGDSTSTKASCDIIETAQIKEMCTSMITSRPTAE